MYLELSHTNTIPSNPVAENQVPKRREIVGTRQLGRSAAWTFIFRREHSLEFRKIVSSRWYTPVRVVTGDVVRLLIARYVVRGLEHGFVDSDSEGS